ncbi:MAG: hypothetical protein ACN6O6_18805 [Pseudomonas sp.]|uniref:hypothetical protein n=1 Tax=Pseudomonas sp. TaxID=306 RepID=UPI003D098CFC
MTTSFLTPAVIELCGVSCFSRVQVLYRDRRAAGSRTSACVRVRSPLSERLSQALAARQLLPLHVEVK